MLDINKHITIQGAATLSGLCKRTLHTNNLLGEPVLKLTNKKWYYDRVKFLQRLSAYRAQQTPSNKIHITMDELMSITGMNQIQIRRNFYLPLPTVVVACTHYYDRKTMLDQWERYQIVHKIKPKLNPFVQFMRGDFDCAEKRQAYQLKKLASRQTKPKTKTVRIKSTWQTA